jgi:putative peptidoglycan lipid II flippase
LIDWLGGRLGRWDTWLKRSVNRRIFAALLTVGGLTVVVKLASTAKELVVAHQFGTGDALDAFLIAFLLPSFTIQMVAGTFRLALIPTYVQIREQEGQDATQRLFSSAMVWGTASLAAISVLLALFAPYVLPIMASGFGPEKLALTSSLFYLFLPALVISGLSTIWKAILNAGERFALVALAPIMIPVVAVAVLLVMGGVWGIYALAVGTVIGFVLEAGLLALSLKRRKFSLLPRWYGMYPAMRKVINQCPPLFATYVFMGSAFFVDQSMAAMLGSGSVSTLNYANRVTGPLLEVGGLALGTAVLPHLSRMSAADDWRGVRHTLKTYTRLILLTTVPLTLILVYFSEPLVGLLFQRGAFTAEDTHLVAQVQAALLLQLPFYMLSTLLVQLVYSTNSNRALMVSAIVSLLLDVLLNYVLMQYFGVVGIALSTVFVYMGTLVFLLVLYRRLVRFTAE